MSTTPSPGARADRQRDDDREAGGPPVRADQMRDEIPRSRRGWLMGRGIPGTVMPVNL